jgi:hypothetical protein
MDVNNFIKDHSNEITFNKNVEMIIISYEKMQNMKSKNICNDVGIKHGSDDNNHNTILHAIALTPFNHILDGYEELYRLGFKIHRNGKTYSELKNVFRNNVNNSNFNRSNLYDQKEHIKFLIGCGANPLKINNSGETACTSIITKGEGLWDAMGCPRTLLRAKNYKRAAAGVSGGSRANHYKKHSNPRSHTRRRRRA